MAGMTSQESKTIAGIETRLGPVGKGHHNSHRTKALLDWLRAKEGEKKTATDKKDKK